MQEKKKKKLVKKLTVFGLAAAAVVAFALVGLLPIGRLLPAYALPPRGEGEVRLHFLDVGQGDCTIVEFSEGDILVVDGGNGAFRAETHLLRYIKGLRPSSVSVLATHSDSDHCYGLISVLRTFDVKTCYLPAFPTESAEYRAFLSAAEEEGCETQMPVRYFSIERENGYLVCLSPRSAESTTENDASAVLYLDFGGVRTLLCGDISQTREELLLGEYRLPLEEGNVFESGGHKVRLEELDILHAAHHGSAGASSEEWLRLLRPQTFLVSCGRGNSYRHPSEEALANFRLASPSGKIYRTDELGDVMITIKDAAYTVTAGSSL